MMVYILCVDKSSGREEARERASPMSGERETPKGDGWNRSCGFRFVFWFFKNPIIISIADSKCVLLSQHSFFHTTSASTSERAFICAKFCGFLPEGSFYSVAIRQSAAAEQYSSISMLQGTDSSSSCSSYPPPIHHHRTHPPTQTTSQTDTHTHTHQTTTRYDYFSSAHPHHYIPGLQSPLPAVIFHTMFSPVCCAAHLHARCVKGASVHWAECNKYILLVI